MYSKGDTKDNRKLNKRFGSSEFNRVERDKIEGTCHASRSMENRVLLESFKPSGRGCHRLNEEHECYS